MNTVAPIVSPYIYPILKTNSHKVKVAPDEIIRYVCDKFEVKPEQLIMKKRKRGVMPFPVIRHICFYMICKYTSLTLAQIGKLLKKDHATVIHSKRCVQNLKDTKDKQFYSMIVEIETELNNKYRVYERKS